MRVEEESSGPDNQELESLWEEENCPICGAGEQLTHAPFCEERDGTPVPESQRELRKLKWMNDRFREIERRITTLERQHGDGSPW